MAGLAASPPALTAAAALRERVAEGRGLGRGVVVRAGLAERAAEGFGLGRAVVLAAAVPECVAEGLDCGVVITVGALAPGDVVGINACRCGRLGEEACPVRRA